MNLADLFRVSTLTDAINKLPPFESKVGASGLFTESGVSTAFVTIDERNGRLVLVPNTSRNDDPAPMKSGKRTRRTFETLHLPVSGQILPAELQGIATFGGELAPAAAQLQGQAAVINDKLQGLRNSIDATREWGRIGAISGKILDSDGSVIYDLYEEFDVTKKTANIALGAVDTDVRKLVMDAKRYSEKKLNGVAVQKFLAWTGPDFFDGLTEHENVKKAYANYQEAQDRLGGDMRSGFTFGGVTFIELDVTVSGQRFIPADVARLVPFGSGIFRTYNSPANYNETVNTIGRPFYSKAEPRRLGKGWDMEAQSNPLSLCLFPEALVEMKA